MPSTTRKENRVAELDGIRGLAILLVLIWHHVCTRYIPRDTLLFYVYKPLLYSWSGVDLFFVLSGFLLGGILLDHREARNYFSVFYARRFCRIFPIYYVWLVIVFLLYALVPVFSVSSDVLPPWTYFSYTHNFLMARHGTAGSEWIGITWSLAVEEQFYLALPFLVRYVNPRRLPLVLLSLILSAPILRFALPYTRLYEDAGFAAYVLMPFRMDSLLMGTLCAYIVRSGPCMRVLHRHGCLLHWLLIASGVAAWLCLRPGLTFLGYFCLGLMYSLFLLTAVTRRDGPIGRLARISWLGSLGIVSYGVHLLHRGMATLTHWAILGHSSPQLATFEDIVLTGVTFLLTLLIARVSWAFFEQPIIRIGHSLRYESPLQ